MELQLSKSERKNMDTCLRRLKQEVLSMKEAGDGLHAQMNSMMGALQELKLLQVQTVLENLDISGRPIHRGAPHTAPPPPPRTATPPPSTSTCPGLNAPEEDPSPSPSAMQSLDRTTSREDGSSTRSHRQSSLGTMSSSSSGSSATTSSSSSSTSSGTESEARPLPPLPRRVSGYTAPQVDFCGPTVDNPPPAAEPRPRAPVDLPGILYSLSREGPSLDSDYSQDSVDDSSDWTSSLMSRSRNRQPLVLGDNVFADLVGNWLDLPELERDEADEEEEEECARWRRGKSGGERTGHGGGPERPDTPAHPLRLSRSQEICRKLSLTTNIFKKFLRGVRPDRDKLLKERPGWVAPELPEGDLFKRPKKAAPKNSKGSFYIPFWAAGGLQGGKGRPCPQQQAEVERNLHHHHFYLQHLRLQQQHQQFSGIFIDRRLAEARPERMQPLFDYNTAVWV